MSTARSAGSVMSALKIDEMTTAFPGTRLEDSFDQSAAPGTAPSRLKAKSMRELLVMQEVAQKNWPMLAMSRTAPAQLLLSACANIEVTAPPALVTPASSWTAKRNANNSAQPPIAE